MAKNPFCQMPLLRDLVRSVQRQDADRDRPSGHAAHRSSIPLSMES